jgi:hypothetical protein
MKQPSWGRRLSCGVLAGVRQPMVGDVHVFYSLLLVLLQMLCFSGLQAALIGLYGESPWHCASALYLPGDNPFRCLELALMSPSHLVCFPALSGSLSHVP